MPSQRDWTLAADLAIRVKLSYSFCKTAHLCLEVFVPKNCETWLLACEESGRAAIQSLYSFRCSEMVQKSSVQE